MKMIAVPEDEYRFLHAMHIAALDVRDLGVQQFNRLPVSLRLAVTSLAAHYANRGLDERGLPPGVVAPKVQVTQPDPITIPCPTCNAKPGEFCASIVNANKTLPMSHAARRAA